MPLTFSLDDAARFSGIEEVLDAVEKSRNVDLLGLAGGAAAWVLASISVKTGRPVAAVVRDASGARDMTRDLRFFYEMLSGRPAGPEHFIHFPSYEFDPYSSLIPHRTEEIERSAALFRLLQLSDWRFVVIPARAFVRRIIPRSEFNSRCDVIMRGEEEERQSLLKRLVSAGYMNVPVVEEPASFAVRGEVVDIFSPYSDMPFRLEFFGDLVERIRSFDPQTQRTGSDIEEIYIHPARQALVPDDEEYRERIAGRIRKACDAVNLPTNQTDSLIEELLAGVSANAGSSWLSVFYDRLDLPAHYLPEDIIWFVDDPDATGEAWKGVYDSVRDAYSDRTESGAPAVQPEDLVSDPDEAREMLGRSQRSRRVFSRRVVYDMAPGQAFADLSGPVLDLGCRGHASFPEEMRNARDPMGEISRQLAGAVEEGFQVIVTAAGGRQASRAYELLKGRDVAVQPVVQGAFQLKENMESKEPGLFMTVGDLRNGFSMPADRRIFLCEEEIFGRRVRRPAARESLSRKQGGVGQLVPGDHVVHRDHGIGRYQGLVRRSMEEVEFEFLLVEYSGGDKLYLPVHRLSLIERYSGAEAPAKLDRLGGQTFSKKKAKVREDIRQMADELLAVHATRSQIARPPVSTTDELYHAFEAGFQFEETADQSRAVEEVMADLEAEVPMDRLVCGDAGYGKTEVAARASMRVVLSGRQAAFLVPTTVLAQQHFLTFRQRLRGFPVKVELLSRFRTDEEVVEVVKGISDGTVDIVVGTHRILSKDIKFSNLGLLVIDEEQRFGVAQKERLKKLRNQVDVLTLTATPIPRTLHMSLLGLRDLSIIGTPPAQRQSVRTFVVTRDPMLIKEAIIREISREGQVFFVRPRVRGINEAARILSDLVPEAKTAVAHGQMREATLERVMLDFVSGRYNVLVCTSIIESGLDIPRANTIIIDEAHRFGLAQLYQLRGRVGRSRRSAFAYLMVPPPAEVSTTARDRIQALRRYSDMGAGFNLAVMDMEIRGAGDMLGGKQAGHVSVVGLDTYLRLLEEAKAELAGRPYREETDPELNFDVAGFIPEEYIPDVGVRLSLYRRLSDAGDRDDVDQIANEIRDRFGPLPEVTENLAKMMVLKTHLRRLDADGFDAAGSRVTVHLGENSRVNPEKIIDLVKTSPRIFRLTPDLRLTKKFRGRESDNSLVLAAEFLKELLAYASNPGIG